MSAYINKKHFTFYFAKPYSSLIAIYILLAVLATVFAIASVLSASNFLGVLFPSDTMKVTTNTSLLDNTLNKIYAYVIAFGREKALYIFGTLIFVIYFFKDVFTYLSSFVISYVRNKIVRNIRDILFEKYLTLPMSFMGKHKKGDLISRISNDVIEYDNNVLASLISLVTATITVLLYFVVLLYVNYTLTLTVLVAFPLVSWIVAMISHSLRRNSVFMQQKSANLLSIIEQSISGLRIIKSFSAIELMNKRFVAFNASYTRLRNSIYRRVDLASPVSEFCGNVMLIAILLYGASWVLQTPQRISASMFVVYLAMFALIIKPAKDIPTSFFNIKKGKASIDRIMEILSVKDEIKEPLEPKPFPQMSKGITYRDVSFSYKEGQPVLKHINLLFEKGKTTAIVGASGSGKSTLIDLIPKFYLPQSGEVLFDDISLKDILSNQIREHIAIVTQQTVLFNDTVFNNITFCNPKYNMQEVKEAARIANADEFIMQLEKGYDTVIGDRGSTLSGGQRQRISIARAVLKKADLLILDEATSALDTSSERQVQESIAEITKGKTAIIIAHRLSTIVGADKIVVLDHGEVKEEGKHKELISQNGIYAKLCSMQNVNNE